ncbi:MAG: A/G-specific adenine glycosylase, partial [Gammaproteobacteria bacterium]
MAGETGQNIPATHLSAAQTRTLYQQLNLWLAKGLRPTFPWQSATSAYQVWVSEIMLQQTQAHTVIPYYQRFITTFASLSDLASADLDQVLKLWSGLGYYSRARNLHKSAGILQRDNGGRMPDQLSQLVALPGIGPSTAGAILALGFRKRGVILDSNVKRTLSRLFALEPDASASRHTRRLWQLADYLTPEDGPESAKYAQAIMNLGAIVCTPTAPRCSECPLTGYCLSAKDGMFTANLQPSPPKPTQPRRRQQADWLILLDSQQRIWMQKRPPTGIWASLWTFPEYSQKPINPETTLSTEKILSPKESLSTEKILSPKKSLS